MSYLYGSTTITHIHTTTASTTSSITASTTFFTVDNTFYRSQNYTTNNWSGLPTGSTTVGLLHTLKFIMWLGLYGSYGNRLM